MFAMCQRKRASAFFPSRQTGVALMAGAVLILMAAIGPARSLDTVDLFTAERIISQSADGARQREVLADALTEVFMRTSGRASLPDHPALNEALEQPQNLMNRFSLNDSDVTLPDAIGNPQPTYRLVVNFAGALVRDALAEAGLPIWSALRPQLTMVLAGPSGDRIELLTPGSGYVPPSLNPEVSDDEETADSAGPAVVEPPRELPETNPLVIDTQDWARRMGVPMFWPLLDLQDRASLSPSIVWAGDAEPLRQLQSRYNTAGVATGYIGVDAPSGQWVGRWRLLWGGELTTVTLFGDSQDAVLRDGMGMIAEQLRSRFAIRFNPDSVNDYRIRVENLTNLTVYSGVRDYLSTLSGTESVTLESLSGDVATYQLRSHAERDVLANLLGLEQQLVPLSQVGQASRPESNADFRLFWQGRGG